MKKQFLTLITSIICAVLFSVSLPMYADAAPTDTEAAAVNAYPGWPEVSPSTLSKLEITYDFGNGTKYKLTGDMAKTIMVLNSDGTPYVDPTTGNYVISPYNENAFITKIQSMVPGGAAAGTDFIATDGRAIHFDGHTSVGTQIAFQQECDYLTNAIVNGAKETHSVTVRDLYDIGNTYVEVDMTNQMLYYYQNGSLQMATQIVTGNIAAGHATPVGIYKVNAKQRNTYLTGSNYSSFVNYWCPIIRNSIGIHDATWRSSFGGSIYKTNGSHGCINVPLENMQLLYPVLQVGTPVVLFY